MHSTQAPWGVPEHLFSWYSSHLQWATPDIIFWPAVPEASSSRQWLRGSCCRSCLVLWLSQPGRRLWPAAKRGHGVLWGQCCNSCSLGLPCQGRPLLVVAAVHMKCVLAVWWVIKLGSIYADCVRNSWAWRLARHRMTGSRTSVHEHVGEATTRGDCPSPLEAAVPAGWDAIILIGCVSSRRALERQAVLSSLSGLSVTDTFAWTVSGPCCCIMQPIYA